MNTNKFSEAQQHYSEGDYRKSARLFLDAVEKGTPIGNGPAYHMAGNSFMQLKRHSDAVVVFEHALRDDTYMRRDAVEANLANAYVRTGDYDSAIAHYEAALALNKDASNYKLYQGTALAYMKQQKYELAAIAYKHAALDSHNPAPGKSLLNLGLAMMASGNAQGAIEAYQAALTSPEYKNKGRALLNTGIAYHSLGNWQDAITALEDAKGQANYTESDVARATLADAKQRLALEIQVAEADQAIIEDEEDTIDPVEAYMAQTSTFAEVAEDDPDTTVPEATHLPLPANADSNSQTERPLPSSAKDLYPQHEIKVGNAEDVERFFALSDKEVAEQGREMMKKERGRFFWVKWVLITILLLGALGGGGAALYFTGFGHPSAEATVTQLLKNYAEGRSIAENWTFDTQANIENEMAIIPMPADFTIDSIDSGPAITEVRASIVASDDSISSFTFILTREGLGWKVEEVSADQANQDTEEPPLSEEDLDIDANDLDERFLETDFEEYMEGDDFDLGEEAPE
ncbi:MAG: tetratricopeptide repeat protein [Coriobacteriia bacterium]|nr:tetratricopeptide repeat protein [Coriobacteriia bacterium]